MKKLGMLCVVLLCVASTAFTPEIAVGSEKEAPMLAEQVEAGKLPPVEERLPEEPLVVKPLKSIGKYGGTWRRVNYRLFNNWYSWEPIVKVDPFSFEHLSNLAKEWMVSEDFTEFSFTLRKGIKWSDGSPLTTEDILFFFEDMIGNDELTPSKPGWLLNKKQVPEVSAVDEWTIVFKFAGPKMFFIQEQSQMGRNLIVPKHYLQQFHPKYADEAELDQKVKDASMESWIQLIQAKNNANENPDRPTLAGWDLQTDSSAELQVATRNPYYWKVDPEGKQLPYIDEMVWPLKADAQVTLMKAIAGEVDFDRVSKIAGDMTVLRKNEEAGKYTSTLLQMRGLSNALVLYVNQNYQGDEEVAELLRNLNFRKALSVAMDREEVIEFTVLGLAEARQSTVNPELPIGDDEFAYTYTDYDPDQANAWLDEAGLDKRDADGFRLLPSGKPLLLILSPDSSRKLSIDSCEIIKPHFEAVGIKTAIKSEDSALYTTRRAAGEHMITIGNNSEGYNPLNRVQLYFPIGVESAWAPLMARYYASGGKEGVELDALQQELLDLLEKSQGELDEEKRNAYLRRVMELHAENLWQIGIMTYAGFPMVYSNRMKNVPDELINTYANSPSPFSEQYYIEE